jgi:hypothetical protein
MPTTFEWRAPSVFEINFRSRCRPSAARALIAGEGRSSSGAMALFPPQAE